MMDVVIADRRTSKLLNGLCAVVALGAIGALGYIAMLDRKVSEGVQSWKPSPHADVQALSSAAVKAQHDGEEKEAEKSYRAALALRPTNESLRWGLAQSLIAQGKRKEAWEAYRVLVDATSTKEKPPVGGSDALAWYADLAAEFGHPKESATAARRLVDWDNGDKHPIRRLSWAHLRAGTPPSSRFGALRHSERAVKLDPSLVPAHLRLADDLRNLGKIDAADRELQVARRLASRGKFLDWAMLVQYYDMHKMPVERDQALEAAVKCIDKSDARSWLLLYHLSRSVRGTKPNEAALRAAQAAVRPDEGEVLVVLAETFQAQNKDLDLAKKYAAMALTAVKPSKSSLSRRLGEVTAKLGRKDQAIIVLRRAIPFASGFDRAYIQWWIDRLQGRQTQIMGWGSGDSQMTYGYPYGLE